MQNSIIRCALSKQFGSCARANWRIVICIVQVTLLLFSIKNSYVFNIVTFRFCTFFSNIEFDITEYYVKRVQWNFLLQNFDNSDRTIYLKFFNIYFARHFVPCLFVFPRIFLLEILSSLFALRIVLFGAAAEQQEERADWEANHALLSITLIKT